MNLIFVDRAMRRHCHGSLFTLPWRYRQAFSLGASFRDLSLTCTLAHSFHRPTVSTRHKTKSPRSQLAPERKRGVPFFRIFLRAGPAVNGHVLAAVPRTEIVEARSLERRFLFLLHFMCMGKLLSMYSFSQNDIIAKKSSLKNSTLPSFGSELIEIRKSLSSWTCRT